MREPTILAETIVGIEEILADDLDQIRVERAAIGLFLTGVKLNTGACATPLRSIPKAVCCPSYAMAMPFPGKLHGQPARDLRRETEVASGIRGVVGIATTNALAHMPWERRAPRGVELGTGVDAYFGIKLRTPKQV
ncbi:MAG TPA: DUF4213 domain-containing protein [Acetobacteraceae bacterium]|nr:DUF4213 domain-containing protein [Acetobacteraceae bacterium]